MIRKFSRDLGLGSAIATESAIALATFAQEKSHQYQDQQRWTPIKQAQQRDLILTPLIGSIIFSVTGITAAPWVVSAIGAVVSTAIVAGIQYLLAPTPPKPADGKIPVSYALSYRAYGVGECRIAGSYLLAEADKKGHFFGVQAIVDHPSDAITKVWLHDDLAEIEDGWVQKGTDGRFGDGDKINVDYRLGAVPETAYPFHVERLGTSGIWTADHRCDGMTSVGWYARDSEDPQDHQEDYPNGVPQISVAGRWAKVWDPRSVLQDPEDYSTWTWSSNPVLILLWHECFNELGSHRDYTEAILPVLDLWKAEADVCDEPVELNAGGTEPRYRCHGWDTAERDPRAGTNAILATFDGWIGERGDGALLVVAGKFREEYCAVITDRDIVGANLDFDLLPADEINRIVPRFNYAENDYIETDTDWFEDSAAQLLAGRPLVQEFDYLWTTSWTQARRLGIRDWRRMQQKYRGSMDVRLSGLNAVFHRWLRVESEFFLPELNNHVIEIRQALVMLTKGGFQINFVQSPDDIEDWDKTTDEGDKPVIPPKPDQDPLPAPEILTLTAPSYSGGRVLDISVDYGEEENLTPISRYKVTGTDEWITQFYPGTVLTGGIAALRTHPVPVGVELTVEVSYSKAGGSYGPYSISETITPGGSGTPTTPTEFTAVLDVDEVDLSARAGNYPNHQSITFWRAGESQPFGLASDISGEVFGAANAVATWTDPTITEGAWNYWATDRNSSDALSPPTAPAVIRYNLLAATVAYLDAMTTKPSNAVILPVNAFIGGLQTDGLWAKYDWFSLFHMPTSQASLLNLKNPAETATAYGTLTYNSGGGFGGDGATGYIGIGKNVNALTQLTTNSIAIGGAFNGTSGNGTAATGLVGSSSSSFFLAARSSGNMISRANATVSLTSVLPVATSLGFSLTNRSGATARENYRGNVLIGSDTQAATTLPAVEAWFLRNSSGYAVAGQFIETGFLGSSHSGAQVTALSGRLATLRTALGLP